MLLLQLPSGAKQHIATNQTYGRGSPECLSDPLISRQQFQLDCVCQGVVQLTNIGMNPIIVERPDDPAAAAAAPHWHVSDLLEKGDSTCLQANCRFYLASLQDTTTFTVVEFNDGHITTAAAADPEAPADLQQQQQQGGGPMSRAAQEAADAALAAALAVEDEEQQQQWPQESSSDGGADSAAIAAEAQEAVDSDRPQKRQRYSNAAATQPAAASDDMHNKASLAGPSSAAADQSSTRPAGVPGVGEGPFSLFAVRGLSPASNTGFLGAQLGQLVVSGSSSSGSSSGNRLVFALASNYMVDMGWLLSACPDLTTADKLIVVHGEKGDRAAAITAQAAAAGLIPPRFAAHPPPLPISFGTHHSKGFLVGYSDGGVRVIIHTANYIYPDCNNKTQGLWYQDFPPQSQGSAHSTPFEDSLTDYVRCLELPRPWCSDVLSLIKGADFSAARVALVASVPGYHTGPLKLHAYGHMRLRALLSDTHLPQRFTQAGCIIQCSSLGSLDEKWLKQEFMASMTAGRIEGTAKTPKLERSASRTAAPVVAAAGKGDAFALMAAASRAHTAAAAGGTAADVPLYIVWPAVSEVQHSREGWAAGYSIPGPAKNVTKPFLQRYWCRFGGSPVGRQSAMPHIKTYGRFIAQQHESIQQQEPADVHDPQRPGDRQTSAAAASGGDSSTAELAWWLVTSHNLSKAAWGSLQVCQRGPYRGHQQLMIRSYELGVLATPELEAAYLKHPNRLYSCTSASSQRIEHQRQAQQQQDKQVQFIAWSHDQQTTSLQGTPGSAAASSNNCSSMQHVYLPVPYCLPPQQHSEDDTPWCVDVQFSGLDGFGFACGDAPFRAYGNTQPADYCTPWGTGLGLHGNHNHQVTRMSLSDCS